MTRSYASDVGLTGGKRLVVESNDRISTVVGDRNDFRDEKSNDRKRIFQRRERRWETREKERREVEVEVEVGGEGKHHPPEHLPFLCPFVFAAVLLVLSFFVRYLQSMPYCLSTCFIMSTVQCLVTYRLIIDQETNY
jgi:hypothetical protein